MSNWKKEFVKCVEGSTNNYSLMEEAFAIKAEHMPKHMMHRADDSFKLFPARPSNNRSGGTMSEIAMFQQKAIFWIAMWHDVFPEFNKRPGEMERS